MKLESYGDLADHDSHIHIQNDETPAEKYSNENDSVDGETNKTSAISTSRQTLPDDEIA